MKHYKPLLVLVFTLISGVAYCQTVTITATSSQGSDAVSVSFSGNTALNVKSARWDFGDGTTSSGTELSTTHIYNNPGSYNVKLVINNSDSVTYQNDIAMNTKSALSSGTEAPDSVLYVPNVFTPNGDGKNDYLDIEYNDTDNMSFQLFTRAGLIIYKTEAKTISWDGNLPTGENVPSGIYYYILEVENSSSKIYKKGFLYIYR
jgi:gliding motility-associated-like protein